MTHSILHITASLNKTSSMSHQLSKKLLDRFDSKNTLIMNRDLSNKLKNIDSQWIEAAFTPHESATEKTTTTLSLSNKLIQELVLADEIILATPMYNFNVPSNLKTYFDLIARVGVTFHYTEHGPKGLLDNKRVTVIITTGGTEIGSDADFMSQYIKHMFSFIGITQVTIIAADKRSSNPEIVDQLALKHINNIEVNHA